MKKLLYIVMLLNFAPIALGSDKDINKEIGYETLTDASNAITKGIKGTIKAVIPGCTVACLTNEALKTNDSKELVDIKYQMLTTLHKSILAAIGLSTWTALGQFSIAPRTTIFFGTHALSGVAAQLGLIFVGKKYEKRRDSVFKQERRDLIFKQDPQERKQRLDDLSLKHSDERRDLKFKQDERLNSSLKPSSERVDLICKQSRESADLMCKQFSERRDLFFKKEAQERKQSLDDLSLKHSDERRDLKFKQDERLNSSLKPSSERVDLICKQSSERTNLFCMQSIETMGLLCQKSRERLYLISKQYDEKISK